MKTKLANTPYIITLIIGMLILIPSTLYSNLGLKIEPQDVHQLNKNWFYEDTNGLHSFELPSDIAAKANQPVRIKTTLNSDFNSAQYLCVRSSLQDLRVTLDGQSLYDTKAQPLGNHSPAISAWHLIALPENASGMQLQIESTSTFSAMSGKFNRITYGPRGDLILDLIYQYAPNLIITLLIFSAGFLMFLLPLLLTHYKKRESIYLGLFSMTIAMWFFSESKMLQFFTDSALFMGSSGYLFLSLFPIPLLLYVKESIIKHTKTYYNIFVALLLANIFIITVLQFTGLVPFFTSLGLTHLLIASAVLMSAITLTYEIRRYHNKQAIHFTKAISLLIVFAGIEMLNFYLNNFSKTSTYTKIGLLLFILIQSMDSITQMIGFIKKSYSAELYEKLAFKDQLTGGGNRMAFEKRLEELFADPQTYIGTRLAIFDLNQLKMINDTWGHTAGDEAIQTCYESVERAFSDIGNCYRIGGDEFSAIITNGDQLFFDKRLLLLNQYLKTASIQLPYLLSIAVGSVCFDPITDINAKVLMHRADMKMYENK